MASDLCYTLVHLDDATEQPSLQEFQRALEKGSEESKIETMKKLLLIMLNGDPMEKLLMHVIRFVLPSKNKQLKKLLHFYWEICPKTNPDGKLKQEFILVWYAKHKNHLYSSAACTTSNALHCPTATPLEEIYNILMNTFEVQLFASCAR